MTRQGLQSKDLVNKNDAPGCADVVLVALKGGYYWMEQVDFSNDDDS